MSSVGQQFRNALAAAHAGEFEAALSIARNMLARDPNDVHGLQIVGFVNFLRGGNQEALAAFIAADRAEPNQPAILYWIGKLFLDRGDFEQAKKALARAVEIAPGYGEAMSNLAECLANLGERKAAEDLHLKAAAVDPANPAVLAGAARYFESCHDLARARDFANRALAVDPQNELALIAISEVDLREGGAVSVIDRLAPVLNKTGGDTRNRAKMHHQLATAQDKNGDYARAFEHYDTANRLQRELFAEDVKQEKSPLTPEALKRMIEFFEKEDFSAWTRHDDLEGPVPVFIVGFSRSGTTWLDQILSSHDAFTVMEEEDNFHDVWRELLLTDVGLAKLKSLSAADVERYQGLYWRRAGKSLGSPPPQNRETPHVVDKVPLNTMQLGLIYRLFPDAKIIFAVRDPRDAVLSCFQQHFSINAAMYQFLTFETAAAFYDRVMTLGEIFRTKLPLQIHDVRYENLVENLESELRPLFDFLEVEWSENVLRYDETARERTILTPSLRQVVERPYTTSKGKWRNYAEPMSDVLPLLNRWAIHFGYAAK